MKNIRSACSLLAFALALGLTVAHPAMAYVELDGEPGIDGDSGTPDGTDGGEVSILSFEEDEYYLAHGGAGGNGYTDSVSVFGNGGDGGAAFATDSFVMEGYVIRQVEAAGGNGGNAEGEGSSAGNGAEGTVALDVTSTDGSTLDLYVIQTGGDGGEGFAGAQGGDGADSFLSNGVVGSTAGDLYLVQTAMGGAGGKSTEGQAGSGGDASSSLVLSNDNSTQLFVSSSAIGGTGGYADMEGGLAGAAGNANSFIEITNSNSVPVLAVNYARGGDGGSSLETNSSPVNTAKKGGDASATTTVETAASVMMSSDNPYWVGSSVVAEGGSGGHTYLNSGDAAEGGNAMANFFGVMSSQIRSADEEDRPLVSALGGFGGHSYSSGNAGNGGSAAAGANITINEPMVGEAWDPYAFAMRVDVEATGGEGGYFNSSDVKGGDGGEAKAGAKVVVNGDETLTGLIVSATQTGGNGGYSFGEDTLNSYGGDGASSYMENNVESLTKGHVSLSQTANGGYGGSAFFGGRGGDASSVYTLDIEGAAGISVETNATAGDAGGTNEVGGFAGKAGSAYSEISFANDTASSLEAVAYAQGGTGGEATNQNGTTGRGGDADSFVDIGSSKSGATVNASAFAYAGYGGWNHSTYVEDVNGMASAIVRTSGVGENTPVASFAEAAGAQAQVETTSVLEDSFGNKLKTKAGGTVFNTGVNSSSLSISGESDYEAMGYITANATSVGNISRTSAEPQTMTGLGSATGSFTRIADGMMGAEHMADTFAGTYFMSATYAFSDLEGGNALLFGMTSDNLSGSGFNTAVFSLSQDGSVLYNNSFASVEAWNSFFSKPLFLGEVSGTTLLEIAMSQVLQESGDGYSMSYAFVVAPTETIGGNYTNVASVPLPAAAPLFISALLGAGLWGRRRRKN